MLLVGRGAGVGGGGRGRGWQETPNLPNLTPYIPGPTLSRLSIAKYSAPAYTGKIFARWHLAIALASLLSITISQSSALSLFKKVIMVSKQLSVKKRTVTTLFNRLLSTL